VTPGAGCAPPLFNEMEDGYLAQRSRDSGIRWHHWQAYTREHHRGIFALFFRSEWEEVTGAKSLLGR